MILYFTNDSKQCKKLLETDYIEDIYDTITAFFEEHHFVPHFLKTNIIDGVVKISFGSISEYFYVLEISEENMEEFKDYVKE